jgi:hypothetical protein
MTIDRPGCPVCRGHVTKTERGFYTCARHGVMPYEYIRGRLSLDQALKMMADWGTAERPRRVSRPPAVTAPRSDIEALLNQLRNAVNPADKRKLRARLRAAGHVGGARG